MQWERGHTYTHPNAGADWPYRCTEVTPTSATLVNKDGFHYDVPHQDRSRYTDITETGEKETLARMKTDIETSAGARKVDAVSSRTYTHDLTNGPHLIYVHSDKDTVSLVDVDAPTDEREARILAALLRYALVLLEGEYGGSV